MSKKQIQIVFTCRSEFWPNLRPTSPITWLSNLASAQAHSQYDPGPYEIPNCTPVCVFSSLILSQLTCVFFSLPNRPPFFYLFVTTNFWSLCNHALDTLLPFENNQSADVLKALLKNWTRCEREFSYLVNLSKGSILHLV